MQGKEFTVPSSNPLAASVFICLVSLSLVPIPSVFLFLKLGMNKEKIKKSGIRGKFFVWSVESLHMFMNYLVSEKEIKRLLRETIK